MSWPQYVVIGLYLIVTLAVVSLHGKPRDGNHNGVSAVISTGFMFWFLWMGGFFN